MTAETIPIPNEFDDSKDLNIDTASIRKVLNGTNKTAISKKYNQRYRFEKI